MANYDSYSNGRYYEIGFSHGCAGGTTEPTFNHLGIDERREALHQYALGYLDGQIARKCAEIRIQKQTTHLRVA